MTPEPNPFAAPAANLVPAPEPGPDGPGVEEGGLKKIAGWLMVAWVFLVIWFLVSLAAFILLTLPRMRQIDWSELASRPGDLFWLIFDRVADVVRLLLFVATLAAFLKRSRWTPRLYMALTALVPVQLAFFGLMQQKVPILRFDTASLFLASLTAFIPRGLPAAIWIPYFLKSKRVKATFVR